MHACPSPTHNANPLANPSGGAVLGALAFGAVVAAGAWFFFYRDDKKTAASPAQTPLTLSPVPITPSAPGAAVPTDLMCQPESKVSAFAKSIGKSALYGDTTIPTAPDPNAVRYVAKDCSFFTWSGTVATGKWVRDEGRNKQFRDWLTKLASQLTGVPIDWSRAKEIVATAQGTRVTLVDGRTFLHKAA